VREALSGVLCRCTGYLKPVQAVLRAAAVLRGEAVEPVDGGAFSGQEWLPGEPAPTPGPSVFEGPPDLPSGGEVLAPAQVLPRVQVVPQARDWEHVGKPEPKVDAVKLVQGKPAFAADIEKRGMLVAKVLHSPHAHARITHIDASRARQLEGWRRC
jgi:putative selenate reductase molybdopterin-binding subunit